MNLEYQKKLEAEFKELCKKLPVDRNKEDLKKQKKMFKDFDPNGNKILSLAEFDKGFRDELKLLEIYKCKKVLLRSYMAVIDLKKRKKNQKNKSSSKEKFNKTNTESFANSKGMNRTTTTGSFATTKSTTCTSFISVGTSLNKKRTDTKSLISESK